MSIINKVISKIREDIIRFKENVYTEKKVGRFINKSYIKSRLNEFEDFCFVGNKKQAIKEILQQVDQIIKLEYYSEYNSKEFYVPKIESINVDTDYTIKKVGNVNEIKFKEPEKIQGKNIETKFSTDGRACDLEQKFTDNGKLITTCKYNPNKEN